MFQRFTVSTIITIITIWNAKQYVCTPCSSAIEEIDVSSFTEWETVCPDGKEVEGQTFTTATSTTYCYNTNPCIQIVGTTGSVSDVYIEKTLVTSAWKEISIELEAYTRSLDQTPEFGFIETVCDNEAAERTTFNAATTASYSGCFTHDVLTCDAFTIRIGGSLSGSGDDVYVTYVGIDYEVICSIEAIDVSSFTEWETVCPDGKEVEGQTFTTATSTNYCYNTNPCIKIVGTTGSVSDVYIEKTLVTSAWKDISIELEAYTSSLDSSLEFGFIETVCDNEAAERTTFNVATTASYSGCFTLDVLTCDAFTIRIGGSLSGSGDYVYVTYVGIDYEVIQDWGSYFLIDSLMYWADAETYCTTQFNTHLATIYDDDSAQVLQDMATGYGSNLWIGLSDSDSEGSWVYADGTVCPTDDGNCDSAYVYWNNGEPNDDGSVEDCGIIKTNQNIYSMLNDVSCTGSTRAFACNKPAIEYWGSYILVDNLMKWADAETYCITHFNTHLATIHDDDSAQVLQDMADSYGSGIWIGLNDIDSEGSWVYADGTECPTDDGNCDSAYVYWGGGEPNNYGSGQDCGRIKAGNTIHNMVGDKSCTGSARAIACNKPEPEYIVVETALKWADAQAYCLAEYGMSLATIYDDDSAQVLQDLVTAHGVNAWVGLNDMDSEGSWVYADGTLCPTDDDNCAHAYAYWSGAEPNDNGSGQDCGIILHSRDIYSMLGDASCTGSARFFACNTPATEHSTTFYKHEGKQCSGTTTADLDTVTHYGTAIECKAVCSETTGCVGFLRLFSGDFEGKCYFRGGVLNTPYLYSGDSRSCYERVQFEEYAGYQCTGSADDILSNWEGTAEECQLKCLSLDGCVGFIRVNSGTYAGQCFFRGGILSTPESYSSDDRDCHKRILFAKHEGKQCGGTFDLLRGFEGTSDECEDKCVELDGCVGFVRVNSGTYADQCFLRGGALESLESYSDDERDCFIPTSTMSFDDGIWPLTAGYCNTQSVIIGDTFTIEFDLHTLTWGIPSGTWDVIHVFDIGDDADALAFSVRYGEQNKALYFQYRKADETTTSITASGRTFRSPDDDGVSVHHEIIVTQRRFIWKMDGVTIVDTDKVPHITGTYGACFPFVTNAMSLLSTDTAIMSNFAVYEPTSWDLLQDFCPIMSVDFTDEFVIDFDLTSYTWDTASGNNNYIFDIGPAFSVRYYKPSTRLYARYRTTIGTNPWLNTFKGLFESPDDDNITVHHTITITQTRIIWEMNGEEIRNAGGLLTHKTGTFGPICFPAVTGTSSQSSGIAKVSNFIFTPVTKWFLSAGYCPIPVIDITDAFTILFELQSFTWDTGVSPVYIHVFDIGDDEDALVFSVRYSGYDPNEALYLRYMKADGSHTSIIASGRTFNSSYDDITVQHSITITQSTIVWLMDEEVIVNENKDAHQTGTYGACFPFLTNGNSELSTDTAEISDFTVLSEYELRLTGTGSTGYEGRVEIYMNGEWGTICNDNFGQNEAEVVCRQLGFNEVSSFHNTNDDIPYGGGSGSILMDNVDCVGTEDRLIDCEYVSTHNCEHNDDVSVVCTY